MAQPKFDYISLAVSKKAGDEVTNSASDGMIFSAQQRTTAINNARSTIYLEYLNQLGAETFALLYKDFIKTTSPANIEKNANYVLAKPVYSRQILGAKVKDDREQLWTEAKGLPPTAYYEAEYNEYSPYYSTYDHLKFAEYSDSIRFLNLTADTYNTELIYLADTVPVVMGGTDDIEDPEIWSSRIIELAYVELLKDIQRREQ